MFLKSNPMCNIHLRNTGDGVQLQAIK